MTASERKRYKLRYSELYERYDTPEEVEEEIMRCARALKLKYLQNILLKEEFKEIRK